MAKPAKKATRKPANKTTKENTRKRLLKDKTSSAQKLRATTGGGTRRGNRPASAAGARRNQDRGRGRR